ncbi:hypothetical protein [Kitasatospora sp. McL0602]|uniref:hypothetical protein n=1 Tax=Kitasatospora sp. McL0602 TaxID=3439530 RepID=UPI003F8C4198
MLNRDRQIVEPLLQPGETLVAAAEVSLAPGTPYPPQELLTPRRPSALEQRIAGPFGVLRKAYAVLNPVQAAVVAVEDRLADAVPASVVHGKGMGGGWRSVAGQFVVRMQDQGANAAGLFAVTERRAMMVVDRSKLWQPGTDHVVHWEEPHAALAELRRHPKGLIQRGRLDLVFTDGSWAGIVTSVPGNADPLATAFARRGY